MIKKSWVPRLVLVVLAGIVAGLVLAMVMS
jgi:hypothetical protein